jgi:hypothetical protein
MQLVRPCPLTRLSALRTHHCHTPCHTPCHTRRAHFQRRPTYQAHLLANKLFDQDNVSVTCVTSDALV